jgi:hypothetical protein
VGGAARDGFPDHHPAVVHDGRHGRGHRLQRRRIRNHLQARPGSVADQGTADRRVPHRLERVRDGSGARQGGQLHHHLLDRKPRPDGRAHRRLDHGGAGANADGQGIPDHAQRQFGGAARNRRGHRWLQRAVRDQPGRRPHDRHRDESARVAFLCAGIEGHRFSDRQGGRQAGGRLHARRTAQRDYRRRHPGLVRAVDRLRGRQDPASMA